MLDWLGPSLTAYRHRTDLKELLAGGLARLLGKRISLAFTGMQGVGKSVLLDQLTGKAARTGYRLPPQSQGVETGQIASPKRRIRISVVPGQIAEPRYVALDNLFKAKDVPQGVVHVVAQGFAAVRNQDAARVLVKDAKITTVPKFRTYQRERELADLDETCEAIRDAHRTTRAPKWLIVAVDKIDLYHDTIEKARAYYAPDANSPFADRLRRLADQAGSDNFRWEAAPVCGCLDGFAWNGREVVPQFEEPQRQAYPAQFLDLLKSYCV